MRIPSMGLFFVLACHKPAPTSTSIIGMEGSRTWVGTDHYTAANGTLDTLYNLSLLRAITVINDTTIALYDPQAMFNNSTPDTFHCISRQSGIFTFTHFRTDQYAASIQNDTLRYNPSGNAILWDYYYSTRLAYGSGHLHTP